MNALLTDLYELTMAAGYFASGKHQDMATFELSVRRLPVHRDFILVAGLQQALEYLANLRFTPEEIAYLRGLAAVRQRAAGILRIPRRFPLHR